MDCLLFGDLEYTELLPVRRIMFTDLLPHLLFYTFPRPLSCLNWAAREQAGPSLVRCQSNKTLIRFLVASQDSHGIHAPSSVPRVWQLHACLNTFDTVDRSGLVWSGLVCWLDGSCDSSGDTHTTTRHGAFLFREVPGRSLARGMSLSHLSSVSGRRVAGECFILRM